MTVMPTGTSEVEFNAAPCQEALAKNRLRALKAWSTTAGAASTSRAQPFLVVTPFGVRLAAQLASQLDELGAHVSARIPLRDWCRSATPLYLRSVDHDSLTKAVAYKAAWRHVFHGRVGPEHWILHDVSGLARVASAKARLRRRCETIDARAMLPDRLSAPIGLHAFHSPDLDRWSLESSWLHAQ